MLEIENLTFLECNFDELFEGRTYKKTEKADDDNHLQNKCNIEYFLNIQTQKKARGEVR